MFFIRNCSALHPLTFSWFFLSFFPRSLAFFFWGGATCMLQWILELDKGLDFRHLFGWSGYKWMACLVDIPVLLVQILWIDWYFAPRSSAQRNAVFACFPSLHCGCNGLELARWTRCLTCVCLFLYHYQYFSFLLSCLIFYAANWWSECFVFLKWEETRLRCFQFFNLRIRIPCSPLSLFAHSWAMLANTGIHVIMYYYYMRAVLGRISYRFFDIESVLPSQTPKVQSSITLRPAYALFLDALYFSLSFSLFPPDFLDSFPFPFFFFCLIFLSTCLCYLMIVSIQRQAYCRSWSSPPLGIFVVCGQGKSIIRKRCCWMEAIIDEVLRFSSWVLKLWSFDSNVLSSLEGAIKMTMNILGIGCLYLISYLFSSFSPLCCFDSVI